MGSAGLVVVDKPGGMTSHDVVARVRRLAGTRRVGHGGTLDPMATGVLVVGVERATRLLTYVIGSGKRYTATIRLGRTTVTDDAEGEVTGGTGASAVAEAATLDDLAGRDDPVTLPLSAAAARFFPRRDADPDEARVLAHGGPLSTVGIDGPYAVFGPAGDVLAIVRERDGRTRPDVVLV